MESDHIAIRSRRGASQGGILQVANNAPEILNEVCIPLTLPLQLAILTVTVNSVPPNPIPKQFSFLVTMYFLFLWVVVFFLGGVQRWGDFPPVFKFYMMS